MTLDFLRLARNILLRAAAVSYVFILMATVATTVLWDTLSGLSSGLCHIPTEALGPAVFYFLAAAKFYAIFILLVPGLAIHGTIKKEQSRRAD